MKYRVKDAFDICQKMVDNKAIPLLRIKPMRKYLYIAALIFVAELAHASGPELEPGDFATPPRARQCNISTATQVILSPGL